jgi:hypothetical protein
MGQAYSYKGCGVGAAGRSPFRRGVAAPCRPRGGMDDPLHRPARRDDHLRVPGALAVTGGRCPHGVPGTLGGITAAQGWGQGVSMPQFRPLRLRLPVAGGCADPAPAGSPPG